MKRAIGLVATLLLGLGVFVAPATASCQHYIAYENNGGGDGLSVCVGANLPSLWNVAHVQAGYCNAIYQDGHDDWNDCISSIYNYSDHRVCAYTDVNYSGSRVVVPAWTAYNWVWPNTFADSISSIKWDC